MAVRHQAPAFLADPLADVLAELHDDALHASPPRDLAAAPDLTFRCKSAADCRLYSSYCKSRPCMCLALPAREPDPICTDGMVTCFMDPCANKQAGCNALSGACEIQ